MRAGSLVDWPHPRFEERRADRERMVRSQMRDVSDPRVLDAMRAVPRHLFIPPSRRRAAYGDHPVPIGDGQTISQPYIVALMTELLDLHPGSRVLEIGTGCGYQAAVLSELTPNVYSVEIIPSLGEEARGRLKKLGYTTVQVRIGDGYFGWEEKGPFDGILVTCAAGHVPQPLIDQLAPGGKIVIPVGGSYDVQWLVLVEKDRWGRVTYRHLNPVRFVPMVGHTE